MNMKNVGWVESSKPNDKICWVSMNQPNLHMKTKHILTGDELTLSEICQLIDLAKYLKKVRKLNQTLNYLRNKHLALIFSKSSTRTRFSFTVAMRELGGEVIESVATTRKTEEPEDFIQVLAGYCHAVMIRTDSDAELLRMQKVSKIPIINGLSDLHHPCQALSDIFTLIEIFSSLKNLKVVYIGDGNNVLHSLLLLLPMMGIDFHYACPATRQPNNEIVQRARLKAMEHGAAITTHSAPENAVKNADVIYTDVWVSMGFENKIDIKEFQGFQVNEELLKLTHKNTKFMHCMPMQRGVEVSQTLPDQNCSIIFQQSENRLHMQKALLLSLLS